MEKPKLVQIVSFFAGKHNGFLGIDDNGDIWTYIHGKNCWVLREDTFYTKKEYDEKFPSQETK